MLLGLKNKILGNTVFRNGMLFAFFSFLNNGFNFLLLFLLAKFLNQESYGYLNLFTVFITIFSILISLNTPGFVGVAFFKESKGNLKKVVTSVLLITIVSLIILVVSLGLVSSYTTKVIGFSYFYQILALLICFFQVFNNLNLDIWRLEERPIAYGLYTLVVVLSNLSLSLFLILNEDMDWIGRIYAMLAIGFIFFILAIVFLIKRNYLYIGFPDKNIFKEVLNFGIPLIPHSVSGWLRQGLDRNIINLYLGASSVGIFSFAFNFANVIVMVGVAFNATNSVQIYKTLSQGNTDRNSLLNKIKKMIVFFGIFTLLVVIGTYIFIPYFMPRYRNSLPFVIPLCLGAFFQCVYFLFVNFLFYFKKTRVLMYITFSISIIHLFSSYTLTKYGVIFTAYITLFSNFLICILVVYYSQKVYPLYILSKNEK